jgi:hypothetical protein
MYSPAEAATQRASCTVHKCLMIAYTKHPKAISLLRLLPDPHAHVEGVKLQKQAQQKRLKHAQQKSRDYGNNLRLTSIRH